MSERLALSEEFEADIKREYEEKKERRWQRRRWLRQFQAWSDEEMASGTSAYGACGYGVICDYCEAEGRCVKALINYCKATGKRIDYQKDNFEDVWAGRF